jgi:hypothetical protein
MVVALGLTAGDNDALEPLHYPPADESRYDEAHGEAVVRRERLIVLHVGEDDIAGQVHGDGAPEDGVVLAPAPRARSSAPSKHTLSAPVTSPMTLHCRSTSWRRAPRGGGDGVGAPVEDRGLAHHVLLLAAVPRTHRHHGQLHRLKLHGELLHGDLGEALDEAGHLDGTGGALGPTSVPSAVEL